MAVGIVDWRQFRMMMEREPARPLVASSELMIETRAFKASKSAASIVVTLLGH